MIARPFLASSKSLYLLLSRMGRRVYESEAVNAVLCVFVYVCINYAFRWCSRFSIFPFSFVGNRRGKKNNRTDNTTLLLNCSPSKDGVLFCFVPLFHSNKKKRADQQRAMIMDIYYFSLAVFFVFLSCASIVLLCLLRALLHLLVCAGS